MVKIIIYGIIMGRLKPEVTIPVPFRSLRDTREEMCAFNVIDLLHEYIRM
jgi:hypothetical protein